MGDGADEQDRQAPSVRGPRPQERAWRTLAPVWATKDAQALTPGQVERLRPLDHYTDRNSDAEYTFYHLAGRFQRYAEAYLFADERILAFTPWTAATSDSWRCRFGRLPGLGRRDPLEGALVVTDRQVFLLRDAAAVGGGSQAWGYLVRPTTPERLAAVGVTVDPRGAVQLRLTLAVCDGIEPVTWTFPPAARAAVDEIATLLSGFLPHPNERHLRRVGRIVPRDRLILPPTRREPGRSTETPRVLADDRLEAELEQFLTARSHSAGVRRHPLACAIIPRFFDGAELLAATQADLIHIRAAASSCAVHRYPLPSVTSVELRDSVLGWHIAWTVPSRFGGDANTTTVPLLPVAVAAGLDVFAALRQALTLLPVEAAGPELPAERP
jgi:hypothetical protein